MDIQKLYDRAVGSLSDFMLKYPWENRAAYGNFLAQTFYYTRHSTKLLTLAASRFDFPDYDLHRRFIVHSQEERGHEFMCQKDLAVLGHKMEEFPELPSTAAFYQRQYYLIEHVDPITFMGYVLCLEGLSALCAGKVKDIVSGLYSEKSVLFLRAHSDEDPDHIQKAFQSIQGLPEGRMALVATNMIVSCRLYNAMMSESQIIAGFALGSQAS